MRYRQRFSLRKLIKRVAFITLVLAFVEVIVIFFLMSGNKVKDSPVSQQIKATDLPADSIAEKVTDKIPDNPQHMLYDTAASIENKAISTTTGNKNKPVYDSTATVKTTPAAILTDIIFLKDTISNKRPKTIQLKKLSNATMLQILNNINAEKNRFNNKLNCVQIQKTTGSNVVNAFKIAGFLRAKGFIIAGRNTVTGFQKGISINARKTCTILTIGSL